ncbi:glycerol-3-phosphate acyltransferase 1, mitochondrial-like [Glandiceps talaboti]
MMCEALHIPWPLFLFKTEFTPDLASFKTVAPLYSDIRASLRPFMGRCCAKCTPISRGMFFDNDTSSMAIRDILRVPPGSGFLSRRFPVLAYEFQRNNSQNYPPTKSMVKSVMKEDRVQAAIQKSAMLEVDDVEDKPEKFPMAIEKHAARAYRLVTNMVASISNKVIGFTGWFLLKFLCNFLSGIQVHKGQMEEVKRASKRGIPMIFLPLHRSHLDYILVTFVLHQWDIKAPHIAAGDNLNIPVFSWFMRHLGGFFIKRKLDREDGKKDWVYRSVLHSYMLEVLKRNQNLEFFLEGGRSRSGKALSPKGGLLSVVVDAYMDGTINDAYIVPVSISYEKVLEGNFNREQMGNPKVKETFIKAMWGVWQVFRSRFGTVRVDFAQPFSLQEYIQCGQPSSPVSSDLTNNGGPKSLKSVGSDNSLYGTDIVRDDLRLVIKGLAEHVICDAVKTQSIMSTNLLAFLLLTKYRQGATVEKLAKEFDLLRLEISQRGRDVGFCGSSVAVVNYAAALLGKHLVSRRKGSPSSQVVDDTGINDRLIPNTCLPDLFELSYYGNAVISVFLMEAVVATAIGAVCEENLTSKQGYEDYVTVSRDAVVEKAIELCDLLQFEFTFNPPCGNITAFVNDSLEKLITAEIILPEEDYTTCMNSNGKLWTDRLADSVSWEDDNDEDIPSLIQPSQILQISSSKENIEKLSFLQSMLAPLIESYWICFTNLVRLQDRDLTEAEFTHKIHGFAKERVFKGLTNYAESSGLETLKNTTKLLNHKKITDVYLDDENKKMIQLREAYREEQKLTSLIANIETFKL